jgi:hypothetical protein
LFIEFALPSLALRQPPCPLQRTVSDAGGVAVETAEGEFLVELCLVNLMVLQRSIAALGQGGETVATALVQRTHRQLAIQFCLLLRFLRETLAAGGVLGREEAVEVGVRFDEVAVEFFLVLELPEVVESLPGLLPEEEFAAFLVDEAVELVADVALGREVGVVELLQF